MSDLLLRAGEWSDVTPESAGWSNLSFRVARAPFSGATEGEEVALVVLGGRCEVEAAGERWELGGRATVFDGMPWALYLPLGSSYRVEGDAEVAVCGARCERAREPVVVGPEDVEIEVRGAGNATRQINHIVKPEFPAERLLVVEVYTPSGNWSSYPPHKHDEDHPPGEVVLPERRLAEPDRDVAARQCEPVPLQAPVQRGRVAEVSRRPELGPLVARLGCRRQHLLRSRHVRQDADGDLERSEAARRVRDPDPAQSLTSGTRGSSSSSAHALRIHASEGSSAAAIDRRSPAKAFR